MLAVAAAGWLASAAAGGAYAVDTAGAREPGWVAGPLRGLVDPLTPHRFSVAVLVILGAYALALTRARALPAGLAAATIIAAHVVVVLGPPMLSSDVFGYIAYARLGTVHHLNPYLAPPLSAPHDALLPFVYWRHARSPYGPLFTLASYPLVSLGPKAMLWALKALAGAASLAVVALVWRGAAQRGRSPVFPALLVGLNPLALIYAVGGAHNDLFMALPLTAALVATGRPGRPALAGGLLSAAAAIKAPAAIAIPYLLAGTRRRGAAVLGAVGVAVVSGLLTLAAFGPNLGDMVSALQGSGRFNARFSGPDLIARLLGRGVDTPLRLGCAIAAGIAGLSALVVGWRRRADPDAWISCAGWAVLAALVAAASFEPWYVVWLLPLAALAGSRALSIAAVTLTTAVIALHLPLLGFVPAL